MATNLVTPGQRLGRSHQYRAGEGTYVRNDIIHSSIVGTRTIIASVDDDEKTVSIYYNYTISLLTK
jgi:exosome complex RNA-binding protein Rrp4